MKRVLIIDDDHSVRRTLEMRLTRDGYAVETAEDGETGVEKGRSKDVDVVLLDLRLPGRDGFSVLRELKSARPNLPVIVITAFDDMETAIEAIRLGAVDHLGKPVSHWELEEALQKAAEMTDLVEEDFSLCDTPDTPFRPNVIVGRCRAMKRLFKTIGSVADSPVTVLLQGESGTGKELVAKAIHYNSRFKTRPFVAVNCAALAPTVLESELFGHEKGAFTGAHQTRPGKFELAQGGTLFLDEIAEVSPDVQVKLLRFLQEREFERVGGNETIRVDVRVIAATNRDLEGMLADGLFRQDLYYRLGVVTIDLPPLRDRREDIPLLVKYFLQKIERELGEAVEVIPQAAMDLLLNHRWPGNVRELENALRRAVLLSPKNVLLPEALELDRSGDRNPLPLIIESIQDLEAQHISNILGFTSWDKTRASKILNISRPTLNKRIREYGIRRK